MVMSLPAPAELLARSSRNRQKTIVGAKIGQYCARVRFMFASQNSGSVHFNGTAVSQQLLPVSVVFDESLQCAFPHNVASVKTLVAKIIK